MHDFVIVQSEDHLGFSEEDEGEDEDLSSRSVIASICPVPKRDREEDGRMRFWSLWVGSFGRLATKRTANMSLSTINQTV